MTTKYHEFGTTLIVPGHEDRVKISDHEADAVDVVVETLLDEAHKAELRIPMAALDRQPIKKLRALRELVLTVVDTAKQLENELPQRPRPYMEDYE